MNNSINLKMVKKGYIGPFSYDCYGVRVTDSQGHSVLDIRGFGTLIGKGYGAHGFSEEIAIGIQDEFGKLIAKLLNEALTEDTEGEKDVSKNNRSNKFS